jgi:hypothetical protein
MSDDLEPPDPRDAGDADVASDDAAEIEALAAAGLGLVMPAPAASPGRTWADVEARARRSTRRRAWTGAVAAAVVLVLAVGAGALLARAGEEAETPAGPGDDKLYVLPPEDAEVAWVQTFGPRQATPGTGPQAEIEQYQIQFRSNGVDLLLMGRRATGAGLSPSTGSVPAGESWGVVELIDRDMLPYPEESGWPRQPVHGDPGLTMLVTCMGGRNVPDDPGRIAPDDPVGVVGSAPGDLDLALLPSPQVSWGGAPNDPACSLDEPDAVDLRSTATRLRLVTAGEWQAFIDRAPSFTAPPTILSSSTTTDPPVTVRFPDEDDARAQITEAIKNWAVRDDEDGTYHHLEDGDDPEFWAPRLAEAGRIAGSQAQEGEGSTIDVTSIQFASEDHAWVTFRLVTDLAGGHVDMQLPLEVRRIDGTWLVTRESLLQLLDRARMAPGATMPSTTTTVGR